MLSRTVPYAHQAAELEVSADLQYRGLFWDPRTGKSKVVIDTLTSMVVSGRVRGALIVSPSGVHENWARVEIPLHAGIPYRTFVWYPDRVNRSAYQAAAADFLYRNDWTPRVLCVSKDSIRTPRGYGMILEFMKALEGAVLGVWDESHHFRGGSISRARAARDIAAMLPANRILSGTSAANSPLGYWGQFELLRPGILGFRDQASFENHYGIPIGPPVRGRPPTFGREIRDPEDLRRRYAPLVSVVLRKDCADLPDVVRSARPVGPMLPEQQRIHDSLLDDMRAWLASGERITADQAGVRFSKLQQAMSGFVIDDAGGAHGLCPRRANPRIHTLLEELQDIPGQVIVWAWFRWEFAALLEAFKWRGISVAEYRGSSGARSGALQRFQAGEARVFLANPRSAGEGLNLSAARHIIWYTHTFDIVARDQADQRATRMGLGAVGVTDLVGGPADEYILSNQAKKRDMADFMCREGLQDFLGSVGPAGSIGPDGSPELPR